MIYLGLWLMALGVSAAEAASFSQVTYGSCSPVIGQAGGYVYINCQGLNSQAQDALNRELGLTMGQLRLANQQLEQKNKEANEMYRGYQDLLRKYEALQDSKLTPQGKALLNDWKLEKAGNLLKRSTITMAHYHALQEDMSYQEVVNILGRPGVEAGRGGSVVSYRWPNPDGSVLSGNFVNGR
jgi:hypothetical protein